jgi:superfamily II helicase
MPRMKRPVERAANMQNAGRLIASCAITLAKIGEDLIDLDPNEWYAIFLIYVDQITTQAELLKLIWEQNHNLLDETPVEIPSYFKGFHVEVDRGLLEVFKAMAEAAASDNRSEGIDASIDDLPF